MKIRKKNKFRPDARHSEFWDDLFPMTLIVGAFFVIILFVLDYFNVFHS